MRAVTHNNKNLNCSDFDFEFVNRNDEESSDTEISETTSHVT